MKIAVMGAGSVGGYFGGLLARSGAEVSFIARGAHLEALRTRGLRVCTPGGDFTVPAPATDRPGELGPVDLVLFCVKSYDTDAAAGALAPLVGPNTAVLTLQNGVDNPDKLAAVLGREHVLPGSARMESTLIEPGVVRLASRFARIDFAEWDGRPTPRAEHLLSTVQGAGIDAHLADDPWRVLWEKFIFLAPIAGVTTLAQIAVGEVMAHPETREVYAQAVEEAWEVGVAQGISLAPDAVGRTLAFTAGLHPEMRTSMQRDRERGRRLELEALSGAVVRLGRAHGIATPVHACIYGCLKPHDERARAKESG